MTALEGHNLHVTTCQKTCEQKFKHDESCKKRLEDYDESEEKNHPCDCLPYTIFKHQHDCKEYKEFYEKLTSQSDEKKKAEI